MAGTPRPKAGLPHPNRIRERDTVWRFQPINVGRASSPVRFAKTAWQFSKLQWEVLAPPKTWPMRCCQTVLGPQPSYRGCHRRLSQKTASQNCISYLARFALIEYGWKRGCWWGRESEE